MGAALERGVHHADDAAHALAHAAASSSVDTGRGASGTRKPPAGSLRREGRAAAGGEGGREGGIGRGEEREGECRQQQEDEQQQQQRTLVTYSQKPSI
jgi:hypothetical protein